MDTKTILNDASGRMQKAIDHLEEELLNVRAGKASPNALNGVMVDYFGSQVPVSGAASVTVPDAKTILIQPWDKNMLRAIEKDIIDRFAGRNFVFLPISRGEKREDVAAFREKTGYTFPMGLDPSQAIYDRYASNYIPRNFLIGADGKVVLATVGYDAEEFDEMIKTIEKILE